MESWIPVHDIPAYLVSSHGRIMLAKTGRIVPPQRNMLGNLSVVLYKYAKPHVRPVARLVADAFLPNTKGLYRLRHINGCKTDNHCCNLEWLNSDDDEDTECRFSNYCD